MTDDGRCHICRQWPLEESPDYTITTCVDCDETAKVRAPPMPGTMWLLGKLIAEKIKEKEREAGK